MEQPSSSLGPKYEIQSIMALHRELLDKPSVIRSANTLLCMPYWHSNVCRLHENRNRFESHRRSIDQKTVYNLRRERGPLRINHRGTLDRSCQVNYPGRGNHGQDLPAIGHGLRGSDGLLHERDPSLGLLHVQIKDCQAKVEPT